MSGNDEIICTAHTANAQEVKTGLLRQKVVSRARQSYEDKYGTATFVPLGKFDRS